MAKNGELFGKIKLNQAFETEKLQFNSPKIAKQFAKSQYAVYVPVSGSILAFMPDTRIALMTDAYF